MHTSKYSHSAARRSALVATISLLGLVSCSSDKSISGAAASTTSRSLGAASSTTLDPSVTSTSVGSTVTTIDPTVTTLAAPPTTTGGPAPTVAPPVPTSPPSSGFTALGAARLVMLTEDSNVFAASELTCSKGMSFDYGEVEQCVEQDDLLVISYRIPEAKRVVEVYAKVGPSWVESYRTTEEYDFELTAVDLYIGDYAGIGHPAAFIGYRIDGTGHYLDFDIVQSQGAGALDVRGVRNIDHGNVGLPTDEPGVVISAIFADSDPGCCPTSMLYQSLDYVAGAWSVNDGTLYPTASAPALPTAF